MLHNGARHRFFIQDLVPKGTEMAVEPVKKITVIIHKELQGQVVDSLVRTGTVHVERLLDEELLSPKELSEDETKAIRSFSYGLSQVDFLLGFLRKHAEEKPGFLKTMVKNKYPMTLDEFLAAAERIDLGGVYARCSELQTWLIRVLEGQASLERERDELSDWTGLEMPLDEVKGDPLFGLMTLRIAAAEFEAVVDELDAEVPESAVEVVGESENWVYCLLLYHPEVEEAVNNILSLHKHDAVTMPDIQDEPEDRLEQVARELTGLERRRGKLMDSIKECMDLVPALEVLREFLVNQRRKIEVTKSFGMTESTVAIEGWVTEGGIQKTLGALEGVSEYLAVEISDACEDDDPPVSLDNPKWVKPFEVLTKLYGPPNHREYDPTWIVAVSFMVFFGFCIGDVGYGLCLIAAFLLLRKYLPLGKKAKDMLTVLTYGSVWAMVIGVFAGSWFGIPTDNLPRFIQSIAVLDGLKNTVIVMGVAMGIGLAHMLVGVGVEFHDNLKEGNVADALIDQGLIFLLFVGGGIAAALFVLKVVPLTVPLLVAMVAVGGMLLLLGRSAKSIPGKLVNGIYETYGTVVGFISDIISYVRLYALGLATFMIAYVINTMAGMVKGIAPVFGIVLMLLILLVGHTFNVAINLLGAFVHPLRLEFVEFFGKFYDDGGRNFSPLAVESKIVMIREE